VASRTLTKSPVTIEPEPQQGRKQQPVTIEPEPQQGRKQQRPPKKVGLAGENTL